MNSQKIEIVKFTKNELILLINGQEVIFENIYQNNKKQGIDLLIELLNKFI